MRCRFTLNRSHVVQDGIARRAVATATSGGLVAVAETKPGDIVVTSGFISLADGSRCIPLTVVVEQQQTMTITGIAIKRPSSSSSSSGVAAGRRGGLPQRVWNHAGLQPAGDRIAPCTPVPHPMKWPTPLRGPWRIAQCAGHVDFISSRWLANASIVIVASSIARTSMRPCGMRNAVSTTSARIRPTVCSHP
jgi:hypothetical protein